MQRNRPGPEPPTRKTGKTRRAGSSNAKPQTAPEKTGGGV